MADAPERAASGDSEHVFTGKLISVRVETVPQPIGGTTRFEIVEHPDAVAIVALRAASTSAEPSVALVRQPRPAIGRETWELPAGLVRPDEIDDPQRTAEREMREETGYAARTWRRLTREYPSPGFSTEAITLYLATDIYESGQQTDGEVDALEWVPLSDALARCQSGEIDDGKTLLGLTLTAALLDGSSTAVGNRGDETMPRDTTNLPLGRMPGLDGNIQPGGRLDDTLKLDGMLLEEFNYAGNSAYQAMEDRARTFNLYLVIIGVLASGLVAVFQLTSPDKQAFTLPVSVLLLALGGILGFVFFAQLIRLRQAHQDSVITMNMIKEYYLGRFGSEGANVGKVLNWRLDTLKAGERLGSVTFVVCFTVAFLDGLALGGAAFVADLLYQGANANTVLTTARTTETYLPAIALGLMVAVVAILLQILHYRRALSRRKEQRKIDQARARVNDAVLAERVSAGAPISG